MTFTDKVAIVTGGGRVSAPEPWEARFGRGAFPATTGGPIAMPRNLIAAVSEAR